MHGKQNKSVIEKIVLTSMHLLAILFAGWLLLGNGFVRINDLFGSEWVLGDFDRRLVVFLCLAIYFLRVCFLNFYLLKRAMGWDEVTPVVILIVGLTVWFSIAVVNEPLPLNIYDYVAIVFYFIGSYINSGSEFMRYQWKKNPDNKGKLYTEGLFRYSMHINYFGDTVLFTSLAFLVRDMWVFAIPLLMTVLFIFMHIPMLDKHLAERYSSQFEEYASKTKKFVPFLY